MPYEVGRSTLIHEVTRILQHCKPTYAIIENVKSLCVHDDGRALLAVLDILDDAGYYVKWNVLNAIHFGLPQCRERVFLICYRKDVQCEFLFSTLPTITETPCVKDIIDPEYNHDMRESLNEKYLMVPVNRKPRSNGTKPFMVTELICKSTNKGGGQGQRVYSIEYPGITICSGSGGVGGSTGLYDVNGAIRTLNVKETLRMFGFPTDFSYSCSDRRFIAYLGDSACVPIINTLMNHLKML
jgi:DNA (cytosine-5)-methyltransferase 1